MCILQKSVTFGDISTKLEQRNFKKGENMQLNENQSALILGITEDGEVEVDVASGDQDGLTAGLCSALARRLMTDQDFQQELMDMLEFEGEA